MNRKKNKRNEQIEEIKKKAYKDANYYRACCKCRNCEEIFLTEETTKLGWESAIKEAKSLLREFGATVVHECSNNCFGIADVIRIEKEKNE